MAFDFLGTFNRSQLDRIMVVLRRHLQYFEGRTKHLQAELIRLGNLTIKYAANGIPEGYSVDPQDSRIGRLISAYEVLGGSVMHDLQVRPMSAPVFLVKADQDSQNLTYR